MIMILLHLILSHIIILCHFDMCVYIYVFIYPDSALNGGNQGPSAPVVGRELHSQSVPPFVFRNRLTDWASPELSSRAESCACGLGPSSVTLGSLALII